MTGTIVSDNYNNGSATPYMILKGYSAIPTIVDGIISYMVQEITKNAGDQQEALAYALEDFANACLYNHGNMLNFYSLIFVDPTEFTQYRERGNMDEVFCDYQTDSAVNIEVILGQYAAALANGQEYNAHTNYQYIIMDLQQVPLVALNPAAPAGVYVNLGQVVLVNQAYEA